MVHITQCEICGKSIEVEGFEPHRCSEHTDIQLKNKKARKLELDTVDYLTNKYGYASRLGF